MARCLTGEVRRRHLAGETLLAIGQATGLARATVRKYAHAEMFPERAASRPGPSRLDPYVAQVARGGVAASATCSTHVLGAVRALNRLDCAIESLRAALNALAVAAPEWLRAHADPAWSGRHAQATRTTSTCRGARLRAAPSAQAGRARWARLARRHHGP